MIGIIETGCNRIFGKKESILLNFLNINYFDGMIRWACTYLLEIKPGAAIYDILMNGLLCNVGDDFLAHFAFLSLFLYFYWELVVFDKVLWDFPDV
jgi:hypothetical protein